MTKFQSFLKAKGISELPTDTEKLAGLYNEFNEGERAEIAKAVEGKAAKEDIENLRNSFREELNSQTASIMGILKEQGRVMANLAQTDKAAVPSDTIEACLVKNADKLKALCGSDRGKARESTFSFKAAGNMSITNNVTGQVPQAYRLPGLNALAQREVVFLDLFQTGRIDSNLVEWVYQANEDGTAGSTAEGAAKKQIDFDILVGSQKVEKYTAYIKATDEMLADIPFMATQINTQLFTKLRQAVESDAYSGNGSTPNLNGVRTVATAWAAGASALLVENPNFVDVARVGITQILVANQPRPNYILMNPVDVLALAQIKTAALERTYVDAIQRVAGTLLLDGIPIIESNLVTADTFLIGNTQLQYLLQKQDIMIEVGYDSDDFTKNYKTIRAEWRGVVYVQNNDRTAFIKGTISTAITALTKP